MNNYDYKDLLIDNVIYIPSGGILIQWSDINLGFGEVLYWHKKSNDICSESMSKEFCIALMTKLIESSNIK